MDHALRPRKVLPYRGCSASQMSAERGGPNSVLKTRAEHFARHLNTRLRSLSETEDGSWSAAGEQVSLSSSSDNDVFYDIDSSLASPQEEAAEPQFINHNHSDNLSDNSEEYTVSDSTSAPSSNGPITSDYSDAHFYDIISEREDLSDCTDQIPEECTDCYKRAMVNSNKESALLPENHINGMETENSCSNVRHLTEMALCDKCVKKKDSCDISHPKYGKVWREDNVSPEESTRMLKNSEKWDDVDLTVVQDDCCSHSTVTTTNNEHCKHNGSRETDEDEWHEESKLASAKDIIHHGHNWLASDKCVNGPLESEEASHISHTETSNGIHEELNTKDVEVEISSCEPSSLNSTSNERLEDLTDSDNNLSLSELLHVLQKEYKNKRELCTTSSCQNSESKSDDSCHITSDATQTDGDVTFPSNQKADDREDDEEEDIEVRRLRFRKCSSLKSGKTPPGTPGRKKIVRFADVLGLDLADVKTFLDEIPTIPKSAYKDLHDIELSSSPVENTFGISQQPQRSERVLLPLFQQPGGQPFFLERVRDNNVCLENAIVSDPVLFAITGTVRVKNIDFHKSVHIRYTIDNWKTFADLQARYVPNSCDGFSDKFSFLLYAHRLDVGNRLEFAVRFQARGAQYWDSNGGTNYVFQCVSKDPSPNLICVPAASTYTPHSPVDTWPSFY